MKRTCDKSWWTWVWIGLFAPMLLWADDYRLEVCVYPPGSPLQEALGLPHNGPETLTEEINDQAIRELLAKAAGVTNLQKTEGIRLVVNGDDWVRSTNSPPIYTLSHYTLKYPTVEARELLSDRFQMQIENYLAIRLTGHTRDFAVASFSCPTKRARSQPSSKNVVLNAYKEIPESWLTLWKENGKAVGYYLIDGELAWTFRFMGAFPWRQVVDGKEFDPKLDQVFADARKKAEANLKARGVVPRLGYCHAYWGELKQVLRKDYGIRWWCPTDLSHACYD